MKKKQSKEQKMIVWLSVAVGALILYTLASTIFIINYMNSNNDSHWSMIMRSMDLEQRIYDLEQK